MTKQEILNLIKGELELHRENLEEEREGDPDYYYFLGMVEVLEDLENRIE